MSFLSVEGVCLDYLVKTGSDSIKKMAVALFRDRFAAHARAPRLRHSTYRALSDVSFELNQGDRLGIIGRNGAGKSTLLRVLAGIYQPTAGHVLTEGAVSTLFDVNLGLNPESTGYENIINLGVMLGRSKQQAASVIDDVAAFTELGEFLNAPVRTYSSGMQMKLSFAVSTAIAPEILLIDEVMGVGDVHFMDKAKQRITAVIEHSHILVLTLHDAGLIRQFCNKVLVLDQGHMAFLGDVGAGIAYYEGL